MSDLFGLAVFRKKEIHPFLGRELTQEKDYSEATAELIDREVRSILQDGWEKARDVRKEHRENLENLAEELISRETLSSQEIANLFDLPHSERNTESKDPKNQAASP